MKRVNSILIRITCGEIVEDPVRVILGEILVQLKTRKKLSHLLGEGFEIMGEHNSCSSVRREHEKIWDEVSLFLPTVFALGLSDVCLM